MSWMLCWVPGALGVGDWPFFYFKPLPSLIFMSHHPLFLLLLLTSLPFSCSLHASYNVSSCFLLQGYCICCSLYLGFHSPDLCMATTFLPDKFQLKCHLLSKACSDHSCPRSAPVPLLHNANIIFLYICSLSLPSTRMMAIWGWDLCWPCSLPHPSTNDRAWQVAGAQWIFTNWWTQVILPWPDRPGFKSLCYFLLVIWLWGDHFPCLGLSFLICRAWLKKINIPGNSQSSVWHCVSTEEVRVINMNLISS